MPNTDRPHMTLPNGDVIYEGEYGVIRAGERLRVRKSDSEHAPFKAGGSYYDADGGWHGFYGHEGTIIAKWRDTTETPADEPTGPVITETVKRIVPGVYGKVQVECDKSIFMAHCCTADELSAAIATLTAIHDAMEGGAQ